jgi:hypothetical protein
MNGFGSDIIDVGNNRRTFEREVQVDMLPKDFEKRAQNKIPVDKARRILSEMGVTDLPSSITPDIERDVLKNSPRLTPEQIKEFLKRESEPEQ